MCGRFLAVSSAPDLAERYLAVADDRVAARRPSWNVAPSQGVPVVRVASDGERRLELLHWGLIPSWAKDAKVATRLTNARAETIAQKPAFRSALARRRCVVPADGFYEWLRSPGGKAPSQPFLFTRVDGDLCAFAGVWEVWRDGRGQLVSSVAVVTTAANGDMTPVHHRMPAILEEGDWQDWLDPSIAAGRVLSLLAPAPEGTIRRHPVSSAVNKATNDWPWLADPVDRHDQSPDLFAAADPTGSTR